MVKLNKGEGRARVMIPFTETHFSSNYESSSHMAMTESAGYDPRVFFPFLDHAHDSLFVSRGWEHPLVSRLRAEYEVRLLGCECT